MRCPGLGLLLWLSSNMQKNCSCPAHPGDRSAEPEHLGALWLARQQQPPVLRDLVSCSRVTQSCACSSLHGLRELWKVGEPPLCTGTCTKCELREQKAHSPGQGLFF